MKTKRISMWLVAAYLAITLLIPFNTQAETIKIQAMRLGSSWYILEQPCLNYCRTTYPRGPMLKWCPRAGGLEIQSL